jgi:hypothetical protein
VLPIRPLRQRKGIPLLPPHQGYRKTGAGQGIADPDHPLVIVQIVGYGAKDPLFHRAKLPKLRHITQLQANNQHFYRIFALDNNNFGKIILILPLKIFGCQ